MRTSTKRRHCLYTYTHDCIPLIMKLPVVRYSPEGAVFETFIGSEATVTHTTNTQTHSPSTNNSSQDILSNMWYLAGLVSIMMNSLRLRGS